MVTSVLFYPYPTYDQKTIKKNFSKLKIKWQEDKVS